MFEALAMKVLNSTPEKQRTRLMQLRDSATIRTPSENTVRPYMKTIYVLYIGG